jgi:RHS repeat-associated protein
MPGRKYLAGNSAQYRYGFNGQEKSTEIAEGLTTAEFWEYDSRIGRRWNLDPKPTMGISEYSTFGNNPLINCDPYGDTIRIKEFRGEKSEHKKNGENFKKTLSEQFNGKVNVNIKENMDLSISLKDGEKLTSGEQKQFDYLNGLINSTNTKTFGLTSGYRDGRFFEVNTKNGNDHFNAVINIDLIKELGDGGKHKPFSSGNMLLFSLTSANSNDFNSITGINVLSYTQPGVRDESFLAAVGNYHQFTNVFKVENHKDIKFKVLQVVPLYLKNQNYSGERLQQQYRVNWVLGHNMAKNKQEIRKIEREINANAEF